MRIRNLLTILTTIGLVGLMSHVLSAQPGGLPRTIISDEVNIKQGQTARLEVANTSNQSLVVWLFFRNSADKVVIKKQLKIKPGASGALEYSFTGPNNPLRDPELKLRAELGTKETKLTSLLRPTLRIVEKGSGNEIRLIGPEGFSEQEKKELRPGNDPRNMPPKVPGERGVTR